MCMYLFVCQEFLGGGILYETLFINGFGSVNGSFDNLMYIYIYTGLMFKSLPIPVLLEATH